MTVMLVPKTTYARMVSVLASHIPVTINLTALWIAVMDKVAV
jgi:hypothetical protein